MAAKRRETEVDVPEVDQVVVIRVDPDARVTRSPRAVRASARSLLSRAERVFDDVPASRAQMAVSTGEAERAVVVPRPPHIPELLTIDANASEVPYLLDHAREVPGYVDAYAAPPRFLWSRAGERRVARAGAICWGPAAVRMPQARQLPHFNDASRIRIGVMDSGVDVAHPDLKHAAIQELNFTRSPDTKDRAGHGTYVAGVLVSRCAHEVRIEGLCASKILSYKVLEPYHPAGYYRALAHATSRVDVMNFSLGGPHDRTEEDLLKDAIAKGVVVVAAMGNEYETTNAPSYPAKLDGVIAVGAVDSKERRGEFSNTGTHIWLVAPGVDILSTVPTGGSRLSKANDHDTWDGTSMATPFVTAAVALLLAKGKLTPAEVRSRLRTRLCAEQTGFTPELGHGLLDIEATLA